jgi:hypothetical protein
MRCARPGPFYPPAAPRAIHLALPVVAPKIILIVSLKVRAWIESNIGVVQDAVEAARPSVLAGAVRI